MLKFKFNGLKISTLILHHSNLVQERKGVFIKTGFTPSHNQEAQGG